MKYERETSTEEIRVSENISEVESNNNEVGRENKALNSVIQIEKNAVPEMEKSVENQELDIYHVPLEELQRKPPGDVNQSILQTVTTDVTTTNSRISTSFLDHVLWPTETPEKSEKQRNRERLPHATTSCRWLLYWEQKERKSKKKEEEKILRAAEKSENVI